MKIAILILLSIGLTSCTHEGGGGNVLPDEKFQEVYIALLDEGSHSVSMQPDSSLTATARTILNRFEISEADFRTTLRHYHADISRWQSFFNAVVERLERRREERLSSKVDSLNAQTQHSMDQP